MLLKHTLAVHSSQHEQQAILETISYELRSKASAIGHIESSRTIAERQRGLLFCFQPVLWTSFNYQWYGLALSDLIC